MKKKRGDCTSIFTDIYNIFLSKTKLLALTDNDISFGIRVGD